MEMSELLSQGITLAVIGMGMVFLFLTILVVATTAMSRLLGPLEISPNPAIRPQGADAMVDLRQQAAITAAIHQYRLENKQ